MKGVKMVKRNARIIGISSSLVGIILTGNLPSTYSSPSLHLKDIVVKKTHYKNYNRHANSFWSNRNYLVNPDTPLYSIRYESSVSSIILTYLSFLLLSSEFFHNRMFK